MLTFFDKTQHGRGTRPPIPRFLGGTVDDSHNPIMTERLSKHFSHCGEPVARICERTIVR